MTNASNPHAATDAILRQIFKAMDAHQAQEIREAYYKAIEGLMTLAEALEIADGERSTKYILPGLLDSMGLFRFTQESSNGWSKSRGTG